MSEPEGIQRDVGAITQRAGDWNFGSGGALTVEPTTVGTFCGVGFAGAHA
jgi:hypothetical protein